jgi:hypothetical protein
VTLPSPEQTVERGVLFEKMLVEAPTRGREELRRLFDCEQVHVRPQPGGFYIAEGKLFPLAPYRGVVGTRRRPMLEGVCAIALIPSRSRRDAPLITE